MKINALIDGENHLIEIDGTTATVDGREYTIDVSTPEPGIVLLKNDGRVYEAVVTPDAHSGENFAVAVSGASYEIKLTDPKRLRTSGVENEHGDGRAEIKSAMPGKVVRILVDKGAKVGKGDGIVVVEAMKMENELKSPKDGEVVEIRASEGETVNSGDVLVVIE